MSVNIPLSNSLLDRYQKESLYTSYCEWSIVTIQYPNITITHVTNTMCSLSFLSSVLKGYCHHHHHHHHHYFHYHYYYYYYIMIILLIYHHYYHYYYYYYIIIIVTIIIVITISVILACPDARWEARRLSGSLFRVFSIPGNSIKSCCKMTCFSQTENGILMGIDGIVHYEFTIHNTHKKQSGCLFQPLWNIFVTWDDDSQYMERKMFQSTNQI